jgi:hypothetical protein
MAVQPCREMYSVEMMTRSCVLENVVKVDVGRLFLLSKVFYGCKISLVGERL